MAATTKSWFYISFRKFDPTAVSGCCWQPSRLKNRATHELFIAQSTGLLLFKQLWIKFDCEGEAKVTPHLEPERVENAIVTYHV